MLKVRQHPGKENSMYAGTPYTASSMARDGISTQKIETFSIPSIYSSITFYTLHYKKKSEILPFPKFNISLEY